MTGLLNGRAERGGLAHPTRKGDERRPPPSSRRANHRTGGRTGRRHVSVVGRGAYSYWAGVATSPLTASVLVLMVGTPIYLTWHMARYPARAFVVAGMGSAVFALTAMISLAVFWRLYPVKPSPNVDRYASPSSAGFGHMVADPLMFALLWYVASFAMAAMVRAVRLGRVVAKAPVVPE